MKVTGTHIPLWVVLLGLILGCGTPTPPPERRGEAPPEEAGETAAEELLENGDFSAGTTPWTLFTQDPGKAVMTTEDGMLVFEISSIGEDTWHVQPGYPGLHLIEGHTYRLEFDMRASEPRTVQVRIQKDGPPWTGYLEENFQVGNEFQHYTFEFTMQETDKAARLVFNLGTAAEGTAPAGPHRVSLDNISLKDLTGGPPEEETGGLRPAVHLNQLGYLPTAPKVFVTTVDSSSFKVLEADSGKEVFSGTLSSPIPDRDSGDTVRVGDFTALTTPGTYVVEAGETRSVPFEIREDIYEELHTALFRFFYLQRCGTELASSLAGAWAHPACHTAPALVYGTTITKEVRGGWHDAGDYGRYVVPAAKAVADIILAHLFYPDATSSDALEIPESGNGVPDVLDEVRDELLWLLSMQDPEGGGVYHKVTTRNFAGFDWPQNTGGELVLSPISPTATADFAAVMAMASRVYASIDPGLARRALEAARRAWSWLEAHPSAPGFRNPPGIQTGEYGDDHDADERYWAACELYAATGEEDFHAALEGLSRGDLRAGLGWADVADYGTITYLFFTPHKDEALAAELAAHLTDKAEAILATMETSGYRTSLTEYPWGSNMTVANNGMYLLITSRLTGDPRYERAAAEHLDYLLGRNPLSRSYITGFGEKVAEHPHHRVSSAAGMTIPGMVVGGPNSGLQDPVAQGALRGEPPAKCYIDDVGSYSTNEVTIYWNSPVYFLVSGLVE
ncbi:glycoside hydrolase family 9 [Spirochaeta thermophila DSM 6578]|uniref:Endoglucanase n=1 Tax=Winmispira thermophila (strain ATCC 700085 / DSM 6578 / Z-1203) TaxID=869211 RepID=G0GBV3_WINT7|nr:glycoside hydrolase family 9 protein [Spirochaeta thermophila]AEJ61964.1 glycoside hydrolase family 9 [Spirochaeta thermophila DSM 6578]